MPNNYNSTYRGCDIFFFSLQPGGEPQSWSSPCIAGSKASRAAVIAAIDAKLGPPAPTPTPPPTPPPIPPPTPTPDPTVEVICGIPVKKMASGELYFRYGTQEYRGSWFAIADVKSYILGVLAPAECQGIVGGEPIVVPISASQEQALLQANVLTARYGQPGAVATDSGLAGAIVGPVRAFLDSLGLTPEAIARIARSPADPEAAAADLKQLGYTALAGYVLLQTIGIVCETVSLGQMETVQRAMTDTLQTVGVQDIIKTSFLMPYELGVIEPARHKYLKQYTPYIPGAQDLIRFVVREVITPELFTEYLARQGFSSTWSKAYWDAHWVLPGVDAVVEAYHRNIISAAERDKYLVWLDYSPDPRPGQTKSDLAILAGLQKTRITRVDVRRGWELGLINDKELVRRYQDLGYEDDAELVADIQSMEALAAERDAVARAAGRIYRLSIVEANKYLVNEIKLADQAEANGQLPEAEKAAKEAEAKLYKFEWLELTPEEAEAARAQAAEAASAYRKGALATFRAELGTLRITPDRAALFIRRYELEAQAAPSLAEQAAEEGEIPVGP